MRHLKNSEMKKLQSETECVLMVKCGFIEHYMVVLKMLALRNKMDPKQSISRIPTSVFREVMTYI